PLQKRPHVGGTPPANATGVRTPVTLDSDDGDTRVTPRRNECHLRAELSCRAQRCPNLSLYQKLEVRKPRLHRAFCICSKSALTWAELRRRTRREFGHQ